MLFSSLKSGMTLYQFSLLDEIEQAEMLWEKGVFLMTIDDLEHNYILYQLEAFYIEVKYHKQLNVIQSLKTFKTTDLLTPYLHQIDILTEINEL